MTCTWSKNGVVKGCFDVAPFTPAHYI
jgi:hypothetical protein